jgi:hypothetical protein
MRTITLTLTFLAAFCSQSLIVGQRNMKVSVTENSLEASEKRPDLGMDYTKVSKFKLASRRTSYRLGEMISLDVALLNTSKIPVFFHKFLQPNFYVQGSRGQSKPLLPYILIEAPTSLDSYILLQPGEMTTRSFALLAGCDKRASDNMARGLNEKDSTRQFEENRFVNWGDLCLSARHPGSYSITVEQGNDLVVVTANSSNAKTAVGVARSNKFTINIVK